MTEWRHFNKSIKSSLRAYECITFSKNPEGFKFGAKASFVNNDVIRFIVQITIRLYVNCYQHWNLSHSFIGFALIFGTNPRGHPHYHYGQYFLPISCVRPNWRCVFFLLKLDCDKRLRQSSRLLSVLKLKWTKKLTDESHLSEGRF